MATYYDYAALERVLNNGHMATRWLFDDLYKFFEPYHTDGQEAIRRDVQGSVVSVLDMITQQRELGISEEDILNYVEGALNGIVRRVQGINDQEGTG